MKSLMTRTNAWHTWGVGNAKCFIKLGSGWPYYDRTSYVCLSVCYIYQPKDNCLTDLSNLSASQSISMIYLSICVSTCQSVCVCLSTCPSIYPSTYLSVCVCLYICRQLLTLIYLPVCLSVCLCVPVSVCQPVVC